MTAHTADASDNATLEIRGLKFSGAGRWVLAVALVVCGAGGGAYMWPAGPTKVEKVMPAADVQTYADQIRDDIHAVREDLRSVQVEQKSQGERTARIEAWVDELRRRVK